MSETVTAPTAVDTPPAPGPATTPGQAAAPAASTPRAPDNSGTPTPSVPPAQAPEAERTPAKKYRFTSQDEAERAHSELQRKFARLGDPDQAAQQLALVQSLRSDPKFQAWAKARLAEQEAGSADPETVKALEIVEQVADRKARELIAPYAAQAAAARLAAVFQAMSQKHPDWQEHRQAMAEVFQQGVQAGYFSPAANAAPSLEFVEHLYTLATSRDPEYAAKQYQKRLAQKQAQATQSSPGTAPAATAPAPTSGISGAFRAALKSHGLA